MSPEMLYIYTIYQEGSFSKAASKLYLSQPALSIAIRKIENEIGMPLFDRQSKPLQLTPAGEIYIDTIKKELLLEKEQQQKIEDIKGLCTGTIRLGGTHYLNAYILPEVLSSFNRKYPGIELFIMEGSSFSNTQMLADRKIDLTFSCDDGLMRDFIRYEMFEDHILMAIPSDDPINKLYPDYALSAEQIAAGFHLNSQQPLIGLNAFAELPLILLRKGNNLHERAIAMFKEAETEPHVKLTLNQLVTAFHLAEAGMGATFVSDRIVSSQNTKMLYYPLDSPLATRSFYILLPQNAYVPQPVRRLVEHIQNWGL